MHSHLDRVFSNQRAKIEKNYGEALLKLSTSLLQRKIPAVADVKSEEGKEKSVYAVWRMVLDENEKLAKARLAAAEVFQQQISENAKHIRAQKLQVTKKCLEQLTKIQEEMQMSVRELDKTKKAYGDEEHVAHEARDKAHDAEEKLKRKKGNFFQSLTSLQKNSAKFLSKKEVCDVRSTGARNEYLLTLAAINAHQNRYHDIDLPEIMRTIDAEVYEKVAEYFQLLSQTELFTCAATHSSFTKVKEYADLITRQYNLQCYLNEWTALRDRINYSFEPCDDDKIDFVSSEHNSGLNLNKEGKRWVIKIAKENKAIREYQRQLRSLMHQSATGQRDDAGGDQMGGVQDLEQKIEETKQNIRKSETNRLKAEARLELLKQAGVNVDEYIASAEIDTLGIFDSSGGGLSRAGSTLSVKTDLSGNVDDGSEFYDSDDGAEVTVSKSATTAAANRHDDSSSEQTTGDTSSLCAGGVYIGETVADGTTVAVGETADTTSLGFIPMRCLALYNYMAQNSDELSIIEHEILEVIGEGDGDGWVKARNSQGVEGFVPESYVEVEGGETIPSSIYPAPMSFSSVDYSMPEWGDENDSTTATAFDIDSFPLSVPASEPSEPVPPVIVEDHLDETETGQTSGCVALCRAVYDYEATCPEELTFVEGQIISIISKHVHDVDDGWWQGTVDGQVGIFPCLVVEELRSDGEPQTLEDDDEEDEEDGSILPPTFSPPPIPQFLSAPAQVIITLPTPEVHVEDDDDGDGDKCDGDDDGGNGDGTSADTDGTAQGAGSSYSYTAPDFDMELPDAQQSQYQAQFTATDSNANETGESQGVAQFDDGELQQQQFASFPPNSAEFPDVEASSTVAVENISGLDVDGQDEGVDMGSVECSPPPPPLTDETPVDDVEVDMDREQHESSASSSFVPFDVDVEITAASATTTTTLDDGRTSPRHAVEVVTGEAKLLDEDAGGTDPSPRVPPDHTG